MRDEIHTTANGRAREKSLHPAMGLLPLSNHAIVGNLSVCIAITIDEAAFGKEGCFVGLFSSKRVLLYVFVWFCSVQIFTYERT